MKICFIICGLIRCIDLVINNIEEIFIEHDINYILCLNNAINNNLNNLNNKNIIKKIFVNDISDCSFRNSLNYCYKVQNGLKLVENNFDLYIIMRTDLILKQINLDNIKENKLYFSIKNMNQFTKNVINKINDNIILTKNYDLLVKLIDLYDFANENNNYVDIVLYNYLNNNNTEYELIDIEYKLILTNCNVIGIAGDSGSGKTTLLELLKLLFETKQILTLETDRYHKWERGNSNYEIYTHLNPFANHIEKMSEDIYDLKIGNEIYQVDYDHSTGKFTQKYKIDSKKNILICGLHTLYENKVKDILDLKVYIDTSRELIKKWKIKRDVNERGYSMKKILKQIEDREKDYEKYILNQKEYSDIIINFYEFDTKLECNLIIQNSNIINKILKKIICLNYNILYDNNNLIIKLKNSFDLNDENIHNILINYEKLFINEYYKEILYFFSIILNN